MTKAEIISELSKRLGDPDQAAFADRIWGYFIESLYEVMSKASFTETMNMCNKQTGSILTDISGKAKITLSTQQYWNEIISVKVSGIPASQLNANDYQLMLSDPFYQAGAGEAFYFADGSELIILTGYLDNVVAYEVVFLDDMHRKLGDIADSDSTGIPNTLIYKAYPQTVAKIKQEIGLTL